MNTDHPVGWIAIAAFTVGLIVRAVKADTLKIALANLGLPPIPSRALPWVALVLGGVAAVLDAKVGGSSWDAAAQAGFFAAASAVFGHELGSGVPGVRRLLAVGLVLVPLSLSACTPGARWSVAELLARKVQCALAHQNLPDEEILKACAIDAKDAQTILDLVGESRQAAAKQAVEAERRASAALCDGGAGAP